MQRPALALVVTLLLGTGGCAARGAPTLADAQAAMRVRIALLNDVDLRTEDVRVDVRRGIAYLRGRTSAPDRERRIVALVRGVSGIRDVLIDVQVTPRARQVGRLDTLTARLAAQRGKLFGVGGAARLTRTASGDAVNVSPLFRFGTRRGFSPALGFGWTTRELLGSGSVNAAPLAELRVRPVMAGIAYSHPFGRGQLSTSLVAGYAFMHLRADGSTAGPTRAIAVGPAFAWRPSATLWIDTTDRLGLQISAGYLVARPRVTFANDDHVFTSRVRAGALMLSVGATWWVF